MDKDARPGAGPEMALLTVGAVAARTGVAASALRFYEERGLIHSVRTPAGHRRFWRATIRRIAFIIFAQRIGFTLDEIRVELDRLPGGRAPDRRDWARLSATWDARIAERMAELQRLRHGLTDCIGCGCLSLETCRIINPGDRVASLGPGPRRWIGGSMRRRG